ncbi:polypeptide N-acetylgalactosaminyltransferase 1-like [Contarinia nasturtii]|uniref:polypeptide N-acetylgalactosaminyltransferase 1-like n=1 Tax=Contarinia nasturtii TaxID=265458 RepID=UPI0012D49D42|nr:polypeptide N-acetylgalactosaminyltransferase 1-like [Contarinia nasturtii]
MFINRRKIRSIGRKFERSNIFCLIIVLFILKILYDLFSGNSIFRKKKVIVQDDLLDYNEDGLRSRWPFQISKYYDANDLQPYISKRKIISSSDLPGDGGEPVVVPSILEEFSDAYSEYQINILASNRVAVNRSLPDYRDPKCLDITYPKLLPSVSIVMAFHNEALSILKRAILSALSRSPDELLEELLLVDDFSDKTDLKEPLEAYLNGLSSKVKLIRTVRREGVIRARMIGAEKARGQVLIFMDGNTEVNDGWMEPLLSRIASDRSVIVLPQLDNIFTTSMAYKVFHEGPIYGIGWNLHYEIFRKPEREIIRNRGDESAPYRTPVLIGCAMAIDREFFFEIGAFDTEMNIYGGESAELSLRTWLCGGAVEIAPCSRVGHYFRPPPFSFNAEKDEVELQNNLRTAEAWMDEYKVFFDTLIPQSLKHVRAGNIDQRIAIRNRFQCKSFKWYLNNIFPESNMGFQPEKIGNIQLANTKYCLDKLGRKSNRQIGIHSCHSIGYTQGFSYQKNHQIVFHPSSCLSIAQPENVTVSNVTSLLNDPNILTPDVNTTNHVVLLPCNSTDGEKWSYIEADNQIVHTDTKLCLQTNGWMAVVDRCNLKDERQKWKILSYDEFKKNLLARANQIDRGSP